MYYEPKLGRKLEIKIKIYCHTDVSKGYTM